VTAPYPDVRCWHIPQDLLGATRKGVHEGGQNVREAGALWLGERCEMARVTAVVFPRGKGVCQSAGRWKVTPEVFGAVTRWAKPRSLSLLGVVHTHLPGVPPRLSRADREYSVQVPGILAVVIGEGGAEKDYRRWGWYLFESGDYRYLTAQDFKERFVMDVGCSFEVREVDADCIRELS
jgi:proteasome lid subunit RPN8/RPN11